MATVKLFYSYAHEDEQWRDELDKHLSALQRQQLIEGWHDREISGGQDWAYELARHLEEAHLILLLVSPDFMASSCQDVEVPLAMKRQRAGQARVIPVLIRPVDTKGAAFATLQALPTNARAVSTWPDHDQALLIVAQGIRTVVEKDLPTVLTLSTMPTPAWNVPIRRNPFFTGREELLAQLHDNLRNTRTTALTQAQAISGLGGIGKTQTAVEYAYRYRDNYHYVFWVRAATRDALIADFVAFARLLQLPEQNKQDQELVVAKVKDWLASHADWLLILDNADDLPMVDDFLPTGGTGHILLTTRAQAAGTLAHSMEVDKMDTAEGSELLLQRAKVLVPGKTLEQVPATVQAQAAAIVNVLDGLPLALDQAGAYIEESGCSLSEYLALYRSHQKELLRRRSRLPAEHPEPVATTWLLSFQKVEAANRAAVALLQFCAFLDPDAIPEELFTRGAGELGNVLGPVAADAFQLNEALGVLRLYSLIRRRPESKLLSIHRLVQAVLKDNLARRMQCQWAERAVRAINKVFSQEEAARYLPQAQAGAGLIAEYQLTFAEAADLLHRTGNTLYDQVRYAEAEPLYQRTLRIREEKLGPEHPSTAGTLHALAMLYQAQGEYGRAEPLYQRALRIKAEKMGPEHPGTATTLHELGRLYQDQGQYGRAESLYQRALRIYEEKMGPEHPGTAATLHQLAVLYQAQEQYGRAEPLYQQALRIYEEKLGPEHPNTGNTLHALAVLYQTLGLYGLVEPLYQRALRIREEKLGPEHPSTAATLHQLAALYQAQGEYGRAEPLYQRALRIREKKLGREHPNTASTLHELARLYQAQGEYGRAEPLYQRALCIYEEKLGPEHPHTAATLHQLARLYREQGEYERAEPLYQRVLRICEEKLGSEHPYTKIARKSYANLLQQMGQGTETTGLQDQD